MNFAVGNLDFTVPCKQWNHSVNRTTEASVFYLSAVFLSLYIMQVPFTLLNRLPDLRFSIWILLTIYSHR